MVSQNKLAEFWEQNSDKRFLDHFWPSRLYYTVLANLGNFGPLLTASTALPTFFRTFHQFDCRAYHFLATAPWKLWPPMWRWELPPISLIFSPAFRLMSTTTHICHNHPNRWLEKRCKIFQWVREKREKCMKYPPWDVIIWQILSRWYFQYTAPALTGDMAAIERVS